MVSGKTLGQANLGGKIMEGSIALKLAAICIYITSSVDFFWRLVNDNPVRQTPKSQSIINSGDVRRGFGSIDRRLSMMIFGLGFSALVVFIRSVYRSIELSDGWNGRIMFTQIYFNVLDGGMITITTFTLNMLDSFYVLRMNPWPRIY